MLLAGMGLGCGPVGMTAGPPTPPAEAAARALVDDIVAAARDRDFATLCGFGDANCPDVLAMAGRDRVPSEPPVIAGTWVLPPVGARVGGLVLQLGGIDGAGAPYATEVLVQAGPTGLVAIQPVYWSGMRVPRDATV
ncbi:MAG TPA: hypothetical protein VLA44_08475, partial [Clostridia bacterium]|nr:hypothetical protein [Clostridia bacterium]